MMHDKWNLWRRWVVANALGELFGLGLTFVVTGLLFTLMEDESGLGSILLTFLLAVASGTLEATIVGLAQWWGFSPWFPNISRFNWWRATLIGALIAYVLGYLPSTIMSLGQTSSETPVTEPSQAIVFLLAAGMGLVGGAVLSFAQWLTMRRTIKGVGSWIPANMLAWMVGMPIIFAGVDAGFEAESLLRSVLVVGGALLVAGIVVGMIHGLALVRIAENHLKGKG